MTGSRRVLVHLLLALCTYLRGAKSQGIGLTLNSVQYTNNSVVNITDIGTGSAALLCTTTNSGCCFSADGSHWYFPDGSTVQRSETLPFYRTRSQSPGTVLLHRNPGATTTGVFRCDILDASGDLQSLYVGIYSATTGFPSVSRLVFNATAMTLTCTSTGGPATNVTWMKDGSTLTVDGVTYRQTQMVTDATTATYQNVLTIAQSVTSLYGVYRCTVGNARGTSSALEVIVLGFVLNNTAIPEHGIVTLDNIGIDGEALRCMTDNTQCCSIFQTGVRGVGQWYFPNGTAVPNPDALSRETGMTVRPADLSLYRTRSDRVVLLHHNFGGMNGIYRCEIPDASGVTQNLYIGIFTANLGTPTVTSLTYNDAIKTLTCISTSGPATYVIWERDGNILVVDGVAYRQTQTVTDATTATYHNVLTIAQSVTSIYGEYRCTVGNARGISSGLEVTVFTLQLSVSVPLEQNPTLGQSYTLTCNVSVASGVAGPPTVQWVGPGSSAPIVTGGDFTVSSTSPYTFTINPLRQSHAGQYTCQARVQNVTSTASVSLVVDVSEISVVITSSGVPTVGQSYSLTCSVTGADYLNPTINYQWFETGDPGVVLARSVNLQLPPLRPTEDSHYTCQATISSPYLTEDLTFNQTQDVTATTPGPPQNFTIRVISFQTLGFSWGPPSVTNGVVLGYIVACQSMLSGIPSPAFQLVVNITEMEESQPQSGSLSGFFPGVPYNCSISASTIDGNGLPAYALITTTEKSPSGSPQEFTVTQRTARNMTFSWSPPAPTERNGVITGYSLSCVPVSGGGSSITMQYTAAGTFTLAGFTPATSYNCSISASNSQGSGPVAYVDVTTLDDAMLFQLRLSRLPTCVNWVTVNADGKLNDIIVAVVQNTELSCQCTLSTERITEGAFRCFENSEQQVTFRARLHGTAQVTSSQLIVYIEQWKAMDVTIAVQGVLLSVDRACIVAVSSFSDLECEVPSSVNAAIIGSVVAVAVLLIAGIVIVVAIFLKRHQAKHVLQKRTGEDQPVVMQWSKLSEPETPGITTKEPDLKTGPQEAPSDYELPMTQCAAYGQGFNPGDRIEDAVYEKVE